MEELECGTGGSEKYFEENTNLFRPKFQRFVLFHQLLFLAIHSSQQSEIHGVSYFLLRFPNPTTWPLSNPSSINLILSPSPRNLSLSSFCQFWGFLYHGVSTMQLSNGRILLHVASTGNQLIDLYSQLYPVDVQFAGVPLVMLCIHLNSTQCYVECTWPEYALFWHAMARS